ncbi:MAG: hypothetical protein ACR2LP_06080 [Candidatus Limnocylindrales bacterium]|nr:hypothetical protein [Chloroflexota bacterium]
MLAGEAMPQPDEGTPDRAADASALEASLVAPGQSDLVGVPQFPRPLVEGHPQSDVVVYAHGLVTSFPW